MGDHSALTLLTHGYLIVLVLILWFGREGVVVETSYSESFIFIAIFCCIVYAKPVYYDMTIYFYIKLS